MLCIVPLVLFLTILDIEWLCFHGSTPLLFLTGVMVWIFPYNGKDSDIGRSLGV